MPSREELIAEANAVKTRFIRLSELSDPVTTFMLRYWTEKKGDRLMPSPSDMNFVDFARYAPKIFVVEVEQVSSDLSFRLVGEDVIANLGFNPKGRSLLSLNSDVPGLGSLLNEFFKWIASQRRAVGAGGTQDFVDKGYNNYEAVYLPLSTDGEHVDRILAVTAYYSNRPNVNRREAALKPRSPVR